MTDRLKLVFIVWALVLLTFWVVFSTWRSWPRPRASGGLRQLMSPLR